MNRKGFAPVVVLLIVAAVLIIGGVWYYKAHQSTPPQISNPNAQTSTTTATVTSSTATVVPNATTTHPSPIGAASILSISLASSSGFQNPLPLSAQLPNASVSAFSIAAPASGDATISSITVHANASIGNNLSLTNLKIYMFRNDAAENGLSDQVFGKAIVGPIVAGQTYIFTDSMVIPAMGQPDLIIMATVNGATVGTYDALFALVNITGIGVAGKNISLFSGNLNGQKVIVKSSVSAPSVASAERDAQRDADIHAIQNALELYYGRCGFYPGSSNCGKTSAPSWAALNSAIINSGISGIPFSSLPNDPLGGGATYVYGVNSGAGANANTAYILEVTMENASSSIFDSYRNSSFSSLLPTMAWTTTVAPTCKVPQYCVTL